MQRGAAAHAPLGGATAAASRPRRQRGAAAAQLRRKRSHGERSGAKWAGGASLPPIASSARSTLFMKGCEGVCAAKLPAAHRRAAVVTNVPRTQRIYAGKQGGVAPARSRPLPPSTFCRACRRRLRRPPVWHAGGAAAHPGGCGASAAGIVGASERAASFGPPQKRTTGTSFGGAAQQKAVGSPPRGDNMSSSTRMRAAAPGAHCVP